MRLECDASLRMLSGSADRGAMVDADRLGTFTDLARLGVVEILDHFRRYLIKRHIGGVMHSIEPLALHGMTLNPCLLAPKSRGWLRLRSRDPHALPELDAGALAHEDDIEVLCEGVRIARRILRAPSLRALIADELEPDGRPVDDSRKGVEAKVRQYAKTVYHPGRTCRMARIRWRSSIRNCGSTASADCALPTFRSCR